MFDHLRTQRKIAESCTGYRNFSTNSILEASRRSAPQSAPIVAYRHLDGDSSSRVRDRYLLLSLSLDRDEISISRGEFRVIRDSFSTPCISVTISIERARREAGAVKAASERLPLNSASFPCLALCEGGGLSFLLVFVSNRNFRSSRGSILCHAYRPAYFPSSFVDDSGDFSAVRAGN